MNGDIFKILFAVFACIVAFVGAGVIFGSSTVEAVEISAGEETYGEQCSLSGQSDPGELENADRIIVEISGDADVYYRPTSWGFQGVSRGSNVSVYALSLGSEEPPETFVSGYLNHECELVRVDR